MGRVPCDLTALDGGGVAAIKKPAGYGGQATFEGRACSLGLAG